MVLLTLTIGCGGGGGSTSGGGIDGNGSTGGNGGGNGGGGGGGTPTPQITLVSPQLANTYGAGSGTIFIQGSNFSITSVVEINGAPAGTTVFQDNTHLQALAGPTQISAPATYSITVSDFGGQSNAMPLTVYAPQEGPQPFPALSGYYTGPQGGDTPIAAGDLNGDGLADVVVGANSIPGIMGTAILLGHADGTLGAPQYIGPGVNGIAIGDVNGDSFPDIVTTVDLGTNNPATSSFKIYLNDGTGNFTSGASQIFAGGYPNPIKLADMRARIS